MPLGREGYRSQIHPSIAVTTNSVHAYIHLVRSLSIILVIIDAFPHSTIAQELISEIAVCCSFPCWACFVIGVWYATPKLSVPGDNVKIRVPRPKVINSIFFFLLFGPFLLDLPSVISSGTFLARGQYTKTNIAIAVHYITLGGVLLSATGIFYFTLNQLAKAIEEYTVPSELTLVHVRLSPTVDLPGGQTFTLSPLSESEKEDEKLWDSSLVKVRHRLISIRNAGTVMLCFYVMIYLIYGITRPLIHAHIVWNVFFCAFFNLDPGTPTIFAYFIFSIMYHINAGPPRLRQVYSVPRPPLVYMPSSRPDRPIDDSFIFDLHRPNTAGVGSDFSQWSPSKDSAIRSLDLGPLSRLEGIDEKDKGFPADQGSSIYSSPTVPETAASSSTRKSSSTYSRDPSAC
ncbi:hypothetical protein BC939DRAFT_50230 [Gamsiella multidivaricata]|uniref:uncharacterized protein n=1 Tax=Gamsiella multidivaricata TaxID=101098 RepID=UPI0022204B32|nr:uncharacterized protein BC939DRAFT_50230 [Gamsiella multidivaricata]KAI7828782.1 hypothetical protein BC939DRAFT_50230 [Gamsiella multidivaricata]